MPASLPEPRCPECGGVLELRSGPGRIRRYRGEEGYEIPASFVAPTCRKCGHVWLDSARVKDLASVFEQERQRRLKVE